MLSRPMFFINGKKRYSMRRLLYCDVESKWKNDHITTFAG